jgi:hypothetical protein
VYAFRHCDDPRLLSDQILPLAVRPPRVLLLDLGIATHAAMAHLAAQPAENGAHQEFRIEAIGARRCSRDTAMLVGWMT